MATAEIFSKLKADFGSTIEHLRNEFARLQIGRASAALVEGVQVESYGMRQPLKAVASISVPEARSLVIQPWDKGNLGPIEKAVLAAGLGLNPINDGIVVRINIPALTEERRGDLVKIVKKMAEEARIGVRNSRQDAQNGLKKLKADGELTEDDLRGMEKNLQNEVDEVNRKIEELSKEKEVDIMKV